MLLNVSNGVGQLGERKCFPSSSTNILPVEETFVETKSALGIWKNKKIAVAGWMKKSSSRKSLELCFERKVGL